MEKIYEQAKDLHVSATVFYASNRNAFVYIDPDLKVRATKEEVIDAFCKGTMIITVLPNNICKPVDLYSEKEYVSILCEIHTHGSETRQTAQLVAGIPPRVD